MPRARVQIPTPGGRRIAAAAFACTVLLASCAGPEQSHEVRPAREAARGEAKQVATPPRAVDASAVRGPYKIGKPYQIAGIWYYPRPQPGYETTGIASWYGRKFHGRRTANGETYDMYALTAAHRTLPLPSKVRVTNLENGRSLVLRVNDRGPFVRGRVIDVSRRGAELLGFYAKGTAKVRVQVIDEGGAATFVAGRPSISREERESVLASPRETVQVAALPPPTGVTIAPVRAEKPLPRPIVSDIAAYSLPTQATYRGPDISIEPVRPTDVYVQAGAFSVYQNAYRLSIQLSRVGETRVSQVQIGNKDFFRVRIGPVTSVDEADQLLDRMIELGYREAKIVVE